MTDDVSQKKKKNNKIKKAPRLSYLKFYLFNKTACIFIDYSQIDRL